LNQRETVTPGSRERSSAGHNKAPECWRQGPDLEPQVCADGGRPRTKTCGAGVSSPRVRMKRKERSTISPTLGSQRRHVKDFNEIPLTNQPFAEAWQTLLSPGRLPAATAAGLWESRRLELAAPARRKSFGVPPDHDLSLPWRGEKCGEIPSARDSAFAP